MIISAINRDAALLTDIVNTLSQIKDGTQPNKPLTIQYAADTCTVDFYVDAGKTTLLFSENTTDDPGSFTVEAGRTAYVPPDPLMNFAPKVSDLYSQPLYYVTATFSDGHTEDLTYRNADNLLLGQVIVSTQKNPSFSSNQVGAIVVPGQQKEVNSKQTDDYRYSLVEFDIYLQLFVFTWKNLSEYDRLKALMNVNNLIRDALYADKYRGGNACLYDNDIDGTFVGQVTPTPSKDVLTGTLKVKCGFLSLSTTY